MSQENQFRTGQIGEQRVSVQFKDTSIFPTPSEAVRRTARVGTPTLGWGLVYLLPNGGITDFIAGVSTAATIYAGGKALRKHAQNHALREQYARESAQWDEVWRREQANTLHEPSNAPHAVNAVFTGMRESRKRRKDRRAFVSDPESWRGRKEDNFRDHFKKDPPDKTS